MSLTSRVKQSTIWSFSASLLSVTVLTIRTIILARWLPVDAFGIFAYMTAWVEIAIPFVNLSMDAAFLHRSPETENEQESIAVYFTLKLVLILIWVTSLIILGSIFFEDLPLLVFVLLVLANALGMVGDSAKSILTRRIVYRRLFIVSTADILLSTLISLGLAWYGYALSALLATEFVSVIVTLITFYGYKPVWRPRLVWSTPIVRYYLNFGYKNFGAAILSMAIDRIDDLWVGQYLGDNLLGIYNRAFAFARYPRILLADPITKIAAGAYAELKDNRSKLSELFFQVCFIFIRGNLYMAGILYLIAPDLIRVVLGPKWEPMIIIFQVMLIYTIIDPLKKIIGYIFIAVGKPEQLSKIRLLQFILMGIALYVLGWQFRLVGIAWAVNLVVGVGLLLTLYATKSYVDISYSKLFVLPVLLVVLGIGLNIYVETLNLALCNNWFCSVFTKALIYTLVYGLGIISFEYHLLLKVKNLLFK